MTELSPETQAKTLDIFTRRSSSSPAALTSRLVTWQPSASHTDKTTTAAPVPPAGAASTHTSTSSKEGSK